MALNTTNQTSEAGDTLASVNLDELAAETEKLERAATAPEIINQAAKLDKATAEIAAAPEVGKVQVFTCVAEPNSTFFVYPNALEIRNRDVGGRMNHLNTDPPAIQIKFNNQRFMTNSDSLAALIRFSIAAWPSEYGIISAQTGSTKGLTDRIASLRKKAALQMSITGLADAHDNPILAQAERHLSADNERAAESLIMAVETLQDARHENSMQQDKL